MSPPPGGLAVCFARHRTGLECSALSCAVLHSGDSRSVAFDYVMLISFESLCSTVQCVVMCCARFVLHCVLIACVFVCISLASCCVPVLHFVLRVLDTIADVSSFWNVVSQMWPAMWPGLRIV